MVKHFSLLTVSVSYTTKSQERRLEVNDMRMLRWMCGVTKKDKIIDEHVTENLSKSGLRDKGDHRENGVTWYRQLREGTKGIC